jgi:TatD DNase family protein
MTPLVDTHCHLDAAEFDADRDAVATAARQAGVFIVVPAVERANFGAVTACCRRYPDCAPAYGIHPLLVGRAQPDDLQVLRATVAAENPVAIGEIGLDFFVEGYDAARQEYYFIEQLKIAREFDLPVILHTRRAQDTILKHLRHYRVHGGIAHAFNGSRQQAEEFIKLGFKLGFGGAMTHQRALRIRELAGKLPDEAIVLETDAPDIPPSWLESERNSPVELPRIAAVLAELRHIDIETASAMTTRNASSVLPGLQALIDAACGTRAAETRAVVGD